MQELAVLCGCSHDYRIHLHPSLEEQMKAIEGLTDFNEMVRVQSELPRPCNALDCGCPNFCAVPLKVGTYVRTDMDEDGFEIVSYELDGPARLCVLERCEIPEGAERYKVKIFPREDEADVEPWPEVLEEDGLEDDPEYHTDRDVRFITSIACVNCVLHYAIDGPVVCAE